MATMTTSTRFTVKAAMAMVSETVALSRMPTMLRPARRTRPVTASGRIMGLSAGSTEAR